MKYISIILSSLLVLSFVGCNKDKEVTDLKETTNEAVEETNEMTGELKEGVEESIEEVSGH